jgi:hypothetical protein
VAAADAPRPSVQIVEGGESRTSPADCRVEVLGPGKNQPEPYPGYGGFVGWVSPIRLRNGEWLLGFSAGYWHASAPTPLRFSAATIALYQKLGLPKEIVAPTGGVAMIMRSTDEGQTWSRPAVMLDTPDDDRHPAFVEPHGPDGTLICSLFTYPGADPGDYVKDPRLAHQTAIIRSFDYGQTWDQNLIRLPSPFLSDETNGPIVLLQDGSILLTISGTPQAGGPAQAAVFSSQDRGATWTLLSTITADHNLDEANATQLPDGRLVMLARPEGDISWSSDAGQTWTPPVTLWLRLYAPSLYTLRDGTLVCLHGSYARGGLRLIFSSDGGQTWIAPAADHGFLVDDCYGYGKATELPDGTLLVADQGTGGHTTADAQSMSLRLLRVRIRADLSGIDLLPPTNR